MLVLVVVSARTNKSHHHLVLGAFSAVFFNAVFFNALH
jgi:hypothetical protein